MSERMTAGEAVQQMNDYWEAYRKKQSEAPPLPIEKRVRIAVFHAAFGNENAMQALIDLVKAGLDARPTPPEPSKESDV